MKYRSKPVEVEAVQFNDDNSYMKMEHKWGLPFTDACINAIPFFNSILVHNSGWCRATDWIIKDGDTFSVMSDEEFQRKYEAVDNSPEEPSLGYATEYLKNKRKKVVL